MPINNNTYQINDTHRSGLRFARRTYLPRAVGLAAGSLLVGGVIYTTNGIHFLWLLLILHGFIWPHLAYFRALRSAQPFQCELSNLQIDAILGGIWIAMMGCNLLPSAVIIAMMGMNNIASGGKAFFLRTLLLQLLCAALIFILLPIHFVPNTTPAQLYCCLPMIIIYPIILGNVTYQTAKKLAQHKQALLQISVRDGLTGLYNRNHWETLLDLELKHFHRDGKNTALALIDIDNFKEINDSYGHTAGDQVIISFAQILQQSLHTADIIGRYGGDEFAAILPFSNKTQGYQTLKHLQIQFATLRFPEYPELRVSLSAGIAECNKDQHDAISWLNQADRALYLAKKNGRNRIELAP
jgi:diguanylate cyclase